MEQVLLYTTNKEKAEQIASLCARLNLAFKRLTIGDIQFSVASVISGDYKFPLGQKASLPFMYIQPELMLFSALKDKTLDRFLKEYRSAGIEPINLKAAVTPFNCSWTLYDLTRQLQQEHAAMHK